MKAGLVADTGGLLRALANDPDGTPTWPDFATALTSASVVIVPALILAEVDYFLRKARPAMRRLIAELVDPATTYELEPVTPANLVRAMEIDRKFADLELGLVDASVSAVCEHRRTHRVLTTDRSHFSAIRIGAHWRQALALVP